MKNSVSCSRLSILFFCLTLALALFSWVGSILGMGEVQSLLSAEGIRWVLGHVVENYVQCPVLGIMLVLLMGMGIVFRSGLYEVSKRLCRKEKQLSRKERRALSLALGALGVYALFVTLTLFLPWNFLLGITGSWHHSPFSRGLVYILSLGFGLSGMVYGYVSDTFRKMEDVVAGMSCMISRLAPAFVTLFFVIQFFSFLEYTRLTGWMAVPGNIIELLYLLFCCIPFFLCARINNKV